MAGLMPRLLARFVPFGMAGLMSRFPARLVPFRMTGLMFTLERETFQADTYTDPANSREDEINAEEKSENIEA